MVGGLGHIPHSRHEYEELLLEYYGEMTTLEHKDYDDRRARIEEDVWAELLEEVEAGEITKEEAEARMFEWHEKFAQGQL